MPRRPSEAVRIETAGPVFLDRDGTLIAERVNAAVKEMLRAQGIDIPAWYICPHRPEEGCACRKPAAGMALAAARDWGLQLAASYVIGDRRTDVEMADAIGGTGILVMRAAADFIALHGAPTAAGNSSASSGP